jgi:hypothetical protein
LEPIVKKDIEARVKDTGDTVTGNLIFKTGANYGQVKFASSTGAMRELGVTNAEINWRITSDDSSNIRTLALYKSESYDIKNALLLWETANGANTSYKILHSGNIND